jgi:hypothetical protein
MFFAIFLACLHNGHQEPKNIDQSPPPVSPPKVSTPFDVTEIQQNSAILLSTGMLLGMEKQYQKGDSIEIQYSRQYPNGCYEQLNDLVEIQGQRITHRIEMKDHTSTGGMCTMAIIPGGFTHQLENLDVGQYVGQILLNNELQIEYTLDITQ